MLTCSMTKCMLIEQGARGNPAAITDNPEIKRLLGGGGAPAAAGGADGSAGSAPGTLSGNAMASRSPIIAP